MKGCEGVAPACGYWGNVGLLLGGVAGLLGVVTLGPIGSTTMGPLPRPGVFTPGVDGLLGRVGLGRGV